MRSFSQSHTFRFAVAIAVTAGIAWLLCTPGSSLPKGPDLPNLDKAVHFGLFGLLAWAWSSAMRPRTLRLMPLVLLGIACSAYGLLLEWVQLHFADGRSFSWWDWVADSAGILVACIIWLKRGLLPAKHGAA